jgi:chemotaxis protein methyltransferase CheR
VEEIGTKDINKVIDAIHDSCGINFKDYAFSSFKRRIIRFMQINKIRDINEFIEIIQSNKAFTDNLVKEITVNVTEMFRDPSFWIFIRDIILPQIRHKSQINIWHAACSTGEEVYSMAIVLKESNLLNKSKIIATDLNSNVLRIAEMGSYTLKSQES